MTSSCCWLSTGSTPTVGVKCTRCRAELQQRWTDSGLGSVVHKYSATSCSRCRCAAASAQLAQHGGLRGALPDSGGRLKVKFDTYRQLHTWRDTAMTPAALLAAYQAGHSLDTVPY